MNKEVKQVENTEEEINTANATVTESAPVQTLAIKDDNGNVLIASTKDRKPSFCSFDLSDPANRVKYYNVLNNPDENVSDFINNTIVIKDIFAEDITIDKKDEKTGELVIDELTGEVLQDRVVRIVIIDMDGKSYQSLAKGIFNSVQRLIDAFGVPTWEQGVPVKVLRKAVKKGQMFVLQAV